MMKSISANLCHALLILMNAELAYLQGELGALLEKMRAGLAADAADDFSRAARADADLLVTVGASLLRDQVLAPGGEADPELVATLVEKIQAASGLASLPRAGPSTAAHRNTSPVVIVSS